MKTELIVDSFAGGGGASLGIERAIGRPVDIAINHDAAALVMHSENHPKTKHVREDVWHANLKGLIGKRKVGLLWASPDCRHFSRAKGSAPVSKRVRSLAWIVVRWASQVRPRVICLENVREFADWGPVVPRFACACGWSGTEGQARLQRPARKCPRCDSSKLVQSSDLVPDPSKKGMTFRLFCNRLRGLGYRVEWRTLNAADFGAPTLRRRLFLIARRDGQPIVWPEPTHCDPKLIDETPLFARLKPWRTAAECIDWELPVRSIFDREKPLAPKTMARIAAGVKRYVIGSPTPFLVPLTHAGERKCPAIDDPMPTITSAHRGELALVSPHIAELCHGGDGTWSDGRVRHMNQTLRTIHSGGGNHAIVSAFMAKHFGGVVGTPIDTPAPTATQIATQNQIVATCLARFNHGEKQWAPVTEPLGTVTSQGNKFALVYAFLMKYFGTAIGADCRDPAPTATSRDRFSVVSIEVAPGISEPAIAIDVPSVGRCVIVDIGMRMLTPRELARTQGFPEAYVLTGTKTSQVARIGNSVCPPVAEAIVRANCPMACEVNS
jgi:DNA (cytosine-5)-methyltransferase 1